MIVVSNAFRMLFDLVDATRTHPWNMCKSFHFHHDEWRQISGKLRQVRDYLCMVPLSANFSLVTDHKLGVSSREELIRVQVNEIVNGLNLIAAYHSSL